MTTRRLLKRILSLPTAPFRESFILNEIKLILAEEKIPFLEDDRGQIIAGVKNKEKLKSRMIFLAHTDHPGFHITQKVNSRTYQALWFGGAPFDSMSGAQVRVYSEEDPKGCVGKISSRFPKKARREGLPFKITFNTATDLNNHCFGGFDFPGFEINGDRIKTRAADDLAGVVIALGALIDQKTKAAAVFTRAEEVGFIGCLHLLEKKILREGLWAVSLEASKTLAGAEIGKGPVLRIGDRSTLFDSPFSISQWQCAEKLSKKRRNFTYQRRLMDGGTCEATALALYGICATGLAVPLLNYHNQGPKGPATEGISLSDVHKARQLCAAMAEEGLPKKWASTFKGRLRTNYRLLKNLL